MVTQQHGGETAESRAVAVRKDQKSQRERGGALLGQKGNGKRKERRQNNAGVLPPFTIADTLPWTARKARASWSNLEGSFALCSGGPSFPPRAVRPHPGQAALPPTPARAEQRLPLRRQAVSVPCRILRVGFNELLARATVETLA